MAGSAVHPDPVGPGDSVLAQGPVAVATSGVAGDHTIRAGVQLARHLGRDLVVVSVVRPMGGVPIRPAAVPVPAEYLHDRVTQHAAAVEAMVLASLRDQPDATDDVPPPLEVFVGDPVTDVVRVARRRGAGVLVVGLGRHDAFERLLSGETASRIVRRSECPVLAVVPEFAGVPRVVVAAMDFSASSVAAAEAVAPIVPAGGRLVFVHVWNRVDDSVPLLKARDDAYARELPARFERVRSAVRLAPGVTVAFRDVSGEPAAALLAAVRTEGADLIAAGKHGHSPLDRLLIGSTTQRLLRAAPCALLVTPEPAPADVDRLLHQASITVELRAASGWETQLDAFSRRNRGRDTTLEIDDRTLGVQAQESGLRLEGVTWDRHDRAITIMLRHPDDETRHLSHAVHGVRTVALLRNEHDGDVALRVEHADGLTLLTLGPVSPG